MSLLYSDEESDDDEITLPVFSGKKWENFELWWHSFYSLVGSQNIPSVTKWLYLLSALSGKALQKVQTLYYHNYDDAVYVLKQCFGNKEHNLMHKIALLARQTNSFSSYNCDTAAIKSLVASLHTQQKLESLPMESFARMEIQPEPLMETTSVFQCETVQDTAAVSMVPFNLHMRCIHSFNTVAVCTSVEFHFLEHSFLENCVFTDTSLTVDSDEPVRIPVDLHDRISLMDSEKLDSAVTVYPTYQTFGKYFAMTKFLGPLCAFKIAIFSYLNCAFGILNSYCIYGLIFIASCQFKAFDPGGLSLFLC